MNTTFKSSYHITSKYWWNWLLILWKALTSYNWFEFSMEPTPWFFFLVHVTKSNSSTYHSRKLIQYIFCLQSYVVNIIVEIPRIWISSLSWSVSYIPLHIDFSLIQLSWIILTKFHTTTSVLQCLLLGECRSCFAIHILPSHWFNEALVRLQACLSFSKVNTRKLIAIYFELEKLIYNLRI